jgi:hypothetical protein
MPHDAGIPSITMPAPVVMPGQPAAWQDSPASTDGLGLPEVIHASPRLTLRSSPQLILAQSMAEQPLPSSPPLFVVGEMT